jgi:hypothetical protein
VVYDTQNYGGSGLCPSSGIKQLEHDVSETMSPFTGRQEDTYSVGSVRKS